MISYSGHSLRFDATDEDPDEERGTGGHGRTTDIDPNSLSES